MEAFVFIPCYLFQRVALGCRCERTADLCCNCCHQAVLLPPQPLPSLPPRALGLISLERSSCPHSPSTCIASIQHCMLPSFPSPCLSPPQICSHWVAQEKKRIPPPTKRTKTWGASVEERPLPLKFRNKNDSFFWAGCSLMWHCDQYQMLGGKDFCQAFPSKIDLTYQLLFVGLTMCVTIKGCCRCIVNTWIVPALCIYYCALLISRKECLALTMDTGPVLQ